MNWTKKRHIWLLSLLAVAVLVACGGDESDDYAAEPEAIEPAPQAEAPRPVVAVAELEAKSESTVAGTATFSAEGGQVSLTIELRGTEPGTHAVHLHETGDCSAPDAMSAGGHWNPTGDDHGMWDQAPFHLGDIGNVEVGADGYGSFTLTTDRWTVGDGGPVDVVGRSVIVHVDADDFTTQPTGAAGGRIACGLVKLSE